MGCRRGRYAAQRCSQFVKTETITQRKWLLTAERLSDELGDASPLMPQKAQGRACVSTDLIEVTCVSPAIMCEMTASYYAQEGLYTDAIDTSTKCRFARVLTRKSPSEVSKAHLLGSKPREAARKGTFVSRVFGTNSRSLSLARDD